MGTSSANPDKLDSYSSEGLDLVETLRTKSNAVTDALEALRSSGSSHVPALGDVDGTLQEVVDDWYHLDEFVGDVASGFFAADQGEGVVTVDDATLVAMGEIGYADRGEAIAAANEMAAELERLLENGDASIEEVLALAEMAERGQYDPAFAVAFSDRVGVEGYADATAMIRAAYVLNDGDSMVDPEGIAAVGVLAQTMTTALDTMPLIGRDNRHDPDNENLSDDQRISEEFIYELTSGYEVGYPGYDMEGRPSGAEGYPWTNAVDLSVLLGMTDPPTGVASAVADRFLTPVVGSDLGDHILTEASHPWGEHGGVVHNYAEMLDRNEDASAMWLNSSNGVDLDGEPVDTKNIELVLQRHGVSDIDGGDALARVVENGLTNEDRPDTREALMHEAIDVVGEQGAIRNEHMHDALAAGVESNMSVVDDHVNDGWDGRHMGQEPPEGARNAYEFFEQVMLDDEASDRVNTAVDGYVLDQLDYLPADENDRSFRIQDLGALKGITTQADINAVIASQEADLAASEAGRQRPGTVVNWVAGRIPVLGDINDTTGLAGHSLGDFTNAGVSLAFPEDYAELDDAQQAARAAEITAEVEGQMLLAMAEDPDRFTTPLSEMSPEEYQEAMEWAFSDETYDANDHSSYYAGYERSARYFEWEWDERTN